MELRSDNIQEWGVEGDDCFLTEAIDFDIPESLWSGVGEDEASVSHFLGDKTPIKDCDNPAYHVSFSEKGFEQQEEPGGSTAKRRRVLHFNSYTDDVPFNPSNVCSALKKSKEIEEAVLAGSSEWNSDFPEDSSGSGLMGLDESSNTWISECFNDAELQLRADDAFPGATDLQIDIAELCDVLSDAEPGIRHEKPSPETGTKTLSRGRKQHCARGASGNFASVAYPFAFIKPCGFQGDVTLKDINRRIQIQSRADHSDPSYLTSAFSGKPVVGRTKILTDGGKGCITIMRTKG